MYMEPSEQTEETHIDGHELQQDQTFYPSFSPFENPPLGHSRPYYFQQEGAYSQRAVSPFQQQLSYDTYRGGGGGGFTPNAAASSYGLLGSGNFGVIRGGTFFSDNDGESSNFEQQFSPYYHNGHGRPSAYFGGVPNPRPQQHEQFANFRDFADINTPSYSQYVVVYANKNSSKHDDQSDKRIKGPKNIIEQLAMLDLEVTTTTTEAPTKKLSKSKRKLALLLPEKKLKRKQLEKTTTSSTIDLHEPLLALS